ncbi:TlpA disulfide reductase family protein [Niabella yanshanensis]|uniref:TlpA disulfide reductase family protein n=1 Tax=Niabella yanshanensis TaxID=577386 RepID=A0ABZ0WBB6_9BACT|nr:TlpA disulfide reductase family protein [Niabella yanshanensis]WQD39919.1 TlpA disulfide reductase family protein [Niabella yanshanensis]
MGKYWTIFLLFVTICLNAQKRFSVTVNLHPSINLEKTSFHYYNGIIEVPVRVDSLSHLVNISDEYYSENAILTVQYIPTQETWYSESFFVDSKPASIDFKFDENGKGAKFFVKNMTNAVSLYDTAQNRLYGKLVKFIEKEAIHMQKSWQLYGEQFGRNDSATIILKDATEQWNSKAILFFKSHSQEYFSFWWFKKQIVDQAAYCFSNDTSYFRRLINDFLDTFPEKYTHGLEGQRLLEILNRMITPNRIAIGMVAPYFKQINKKVNVLSGINEKYLLMHFWATWCIPCKKQIPMLQRVKNNASPGKLAIVSICQFSDSIAMKKDIRLHQLNWRNVYDKYNEIGRSFDISSIPYLILVDQQGVVQYIDSNDDPEISEERILSIVNEAANLN